jgi:hypothetical protein
MKRLCQYANILGIPGQGVHSIRIFNIAVVDVLLTFVLAYFIYKMLNKKSSHPWYINLNFWIILGLCFLVGIAMHWLFCVDTAVNRFLFGKV